MESLQNFLDRAPDQMLFWVMLGIGLAMFVSLMRRGLGMAVGKKHTVSAKVVDKDQQSTRSAKTGQVRQTYVVAFDTGGIVLRLFVSMWVFDMVQVGEKGKLTYQGKRFISFK